MQNCLRIFMRVIAVMIMVSPVGLRPAGGAVSSQADASDSSEQSVTNAMCPVLTDEPVDPDIFIEFEGRRVYFCCRKCKTEFQRNTEEYRDSLANVMPASLQQAMPDDSSDEHADHEHDASEHEEHEHGAASGEGFWSKLVNWLGRLHPAFVNFPIALLIAAAIAELLLMTTGNVFFDNAARFCAVIGVISALVAAALGWCFGGFHLADGDWVMTTHRWLGSSTAVWSLFIAGFIPKGGPAQPTTDRRGFRLVLFVGAMAVGVTGFFGGALVYGLDHYLW